MRLLPAILLLATAVRALDADSDGDGLSDFAERHKYLTDPGNADSDGDGVPDGDWDERREYAYTVRTVLRVLRPAAAVCDDYQDARVREETDEYVELEVIHYPLNTVAEDVTATRDWRTAPDRPVEFLASTTTSNWDAPMREALLAELREAGIDPGALDDRTFVERATALLIDRSVRTKDLTAYFTRFPGGAPEVVPGLEAAIARRDPGGFDLAERWQRDLFARGMYRRRVHGSCTSTSIYLQGCLRAAGIPTRTLLFVPAVDPSDPDEVAMVERLGNPDVRATLRAFLGPVRGSWVAHTLNEVWVGGRWRRLNYARLGQNILDRKYLGLMTHTLTVRDWADAGVAETVGRRQGLQRSDDVFGHLNPYSALEISDAFGAHARSVSLGR